MTDREAIEALTDKSVVNPYLTLDALEIAIDALRERAERKTGKWVFDKRFPHRFWFCTCCEWYNDYSNKEFKYCPNCGAKMEVDE